MTIFLTIIITLVVWQLLCVLFTVFVSEEDSFVFFSTFIFSSIFCFIVKPIYELIEKIRIYWYNKDYKIYTLYEKNDRDNIYYPIQTLCIKNDFSEQFNIKETTKGITDKFIIIPKKEKIRNINFLKHYTIKEDFTGTIIEQYGIEYIKNYMI